MPLGKVFLAKPQRGMGTMHDLDPFIRRSLRLPKSDARSLDQIC
jgi:hypothetical protein